MLTPGQVDQVARLARLHLSQEERAAFTSQINEILGYVDKLMEIDVSGVEPTAYAVPLQNVYRPDCARPSFPREEMLANAPDRVDGFFKVPKILEDANAVEGGNV